MTFILPLTSLLILHGSLFDLTDYSFRSSRVYNDRAIEPFIQTNKINELIAEYRLIETEAEYREFLGLDVASNLKVLVNQYYYAFDWNLKKNLEPVPSKVQIAIKVMLKTVNKTVPFNAPQIRDWEIGGTDQLYTPTKKENTHYVKSIVYGYEGFQLIYADTRNTQQRAALMEDLLASIGRSGTLDEAFSGKLWAALEKNGVYSYGSKHVFGVFPPNTTPIWGFEDMLSFKSRLENIMETETDAQGNTLYYEMQPLSLISTSFPLVEINSRIFNQLDDIEKKYEDVRIALEEFNEMSNSLEENSLTCKQEDKLESFRNGLLSVEGDIEEAIRKMDISTSGSIYQFSEALASYGNTDDIHKYRRKFNRFRQQFSN